MYYQQRTPGGFKVWSEYLDHLAGEGATLYDAWRDHKKRLDARMELEALMSKGVAC